MSAARDVREACVEAARKIVGSGGAMERFDGAVERVLSPRYHARPPLIEVGEHDGAAPALRFTCPSCGARVAPDAIDWGLGVVLPPLPGYCPECERALGELSQSKVEGALQREGEES